MLFQAIVFATLAILPSDRIAMADRLYDRGKYAEAMKEYEAVRNAGGIEKDAILYRLAECSRSLGKKAQAIGYYDELIKSYPLCAYVQRSRLMRALCLDDEAQKCLELNLLDNEQTEKALRATALYHLGVLKKDAEKFAKCISVDPKGKYAIKARFNHAAIKAADKDQTVRRGAMGELMEVVFGDDPELAERALYLAAATSYNDKRWSEASSLFKRYLKNYARGKYIADARINAAWSDYMCGNFADCIALTAKGKSEDEIYLAALCESQAGDKNKVRERLSEYMQRFPSGRYRKDVELRLSRLVFDEAAKNSENAKLIEAAKKSVALSGSSADMLRLAWAYEKSGEAGQAAAIYYRIAEKHPGSRDAAQALYRKAMIELREENWSAAGLSLSEAVKSDAAYGNRGDVLYWMGYAALRLGHEKEAEDSLRKALEKGIDLDCSREARIAIADIEYKRGNLDAARDAFKKLVQEGAAERMSAAKINAVGRFLFGRGDYEEAKLCAMALLKAAEEPQWRQAALILKADSERKQGFFPAAIEAYRKALDNDTLTEYAPGAFLELGKLELRMGELDVAEATLRKAVKLNAKDNRARLESYLELAMLCEKRGNAKDACAYATIVMTLFDDKDAASIARQILEKHPEVAK